MLGLLRRRRLLAPVLLGTMLTGGCQLFGTDSQPITRSGLGDNKTPKNNLQQQATATASAAKKDAAPALPPVVQVSQSQPDELREVPLPRMDQESKVATQASYIAPTSPRGESPRRVDVLPPGTLMSTSTFEIQPTVSSASGPAGVNLRPDPRQRSMEGTISRNPNTTPGDGRAERDSEMTMKINTGTDMKKLEERMQQLEQRLEQRDRAVRQSGVEVQAAADEVQKTRVHVETWRKEVDETRAKIHNRDQEDMASLRKTIATLQRLLDDGAPTP